LKWEENGWTEDRLKKIMQEFVSNQKLYAEIVRISLLMSGNVAFYDRDECTRLQHRITSLLAVLYLCQTLSMNSVELRVYLDRESNTACELERTRVFVKMVERYKKKFACVGGDGMNPLLTVVGACEWW
jgi:hypothetical protein